MKKLLSLLALSLTLTFIFSLAPVLADAGGTICESISRFTGMECNPDADAEGILGGIITPIVNILLFLIGAIAVIMLIIGGFRYVISGGDPEAIKSAKNTILYAIIGIVVAFVSYATVNFVLARLG